MWLFGPAAYCKVEPVTSKRAVRLESRQASDLHNPLTESESRRPGPATQWQTPFTWRPQYCFCLSDNSKLSFCNKKYWVNISNNNALQNVVSVCFPSMKWWTDLISGLKENPDGSYWVVKSETDSLQGKGVKLERLLLYCLWVTPP